jgi:hypothetical protein
MKLTVLRPFSLKVGAAQHTHDVGEADVDDEVAEVALGCGWAVPAASDPARPATKARKGAPENK